MLVPAVARRPVARVAEDEETGAYPGPNVYVLRPDELVVDPWFLAGMLSTGEGATNCARQFQHPAGATDRPTPIASARSAYRDSTPFRC